MQKLSGRFMAVFLQDYPRDDLTREIVQPLQGGFNIVGKYHTIFKRDD